MERCQVINFTKDARFPDAYWPTPTMTWKSHGYLFHITDPLGGGCFVSLSANNAKPYHDDVIKWKHFPRYWPFVRGIHRSPVNSSHKGLWRGALMFSLICVWINGWVNNREAGDLRRYRTHYDVTAMWISLLSAFGNIQFTV